MKHVQENARLVEVLETYLGELAAGHPPQVETFLAEHPDLADELRPCLAALEFIHGSPSGSAVEAGDESAAPGMALGDFQIKREIGRGGMGVVYEAEQMSLGRRVALKVLPFAAVMDSRQIQRFKNEAQAAAHLHHTHIVPVYFVGSERGVHFYAMQYIEGTTVAGMVRELRALEGRNGHGPSHKSSAALDAITKGRRSQTATYCRSVARLGVQAAEALDHAHQQGVIHRDIKPANLIIDTNGHLWIADFGLASFSNNPGLTMTGDIVGTVRYMSPEQALAKRVPVDHRTDIYSLGVTLYEFLTLEGAYQGDDPHRVIQDIAFREPKSARSLNPAVPAELETIVMKAMAKSPHERYATAQELADDLERFLEHKPIEARRPTLLQRVAKWAHRNKQLVAAAAAMPVLAVVALAVSTLLIAQEKARTETALNRAQANFRKLREAVDEMLTTVGDEDLADIPHMVPVREKLLKRALAYWQDFLGEEGEDPEIRRETGLAHERVGEIRRLLGQREEAEQSYRDAIALLEDLAPTPANRLSLAVANRSLGKVAHQEEAAAALSRAIETLGELKNEFPADPEYRFELAKTLFQRANHIDDTSGARAAVEAYRDVKDRFTRLAEEFREDARYRRWLAFTCFNLGSCWSKLAGSEFSREAPAAAEASPERREAEAQYSEALTLLLELVEANPDDRQLRGSLAATYDQLSITYRCLGRQEAAADYALDAVEATRKLADDFGSVPRYRHSLAMNLSNAVLVAHAHDPVRGEAMLNEAIAIEQALQRMFPENRDYPHYEAIFRRNLGNLLLALHRLPEADEALRKAISLWDRLAEGGPDTLYRTSAAEAETKRGSVWVKAGDFAKAAGAFCHAVDRLQTVVDDSPEPRLVKRLATYWNDWGVALFQKGDFDDAITKLRRARDLDLDHAVTFGNLGNVLRETALALSRKGRRDEAVAHYREALHAFEEWARRDTGNPKPHLKTAETLWLLADLTPAPERFEEKEALCRRGIELCEQLAKEFPGNARVPDLLASILHALGDAHLANGHAQQAGAAYERAVAARETSLQLKPDDADYQHFLRNHLEAMARALIETGDHARAAKTALEMPRRFPERPGPHWRAARLLQQCVGQADSDGEPAAAQSYIGDVVEQWQAALRLAPERAARHNEVAWILATHADPRYRRTAVAVELARRAVELSAEEGGHWNTLGVALCRKGAWKDGAKALKESMALRDGGDAYDWFFLAMALWELGEKEKAAAFYDKAVAWTSEHKPDNEELDRFRAEAEELLGLKKKG